MSTFIRVIATSLQCGETPPPPPGQIKMSNFMALVLMSFGYDQMIYCTIREVPKQGHRRSRVERANTKCPGVL